MHEQLGWPHMLGGRAYQNSLRKIYEGLDYSAYEQSGTTQKFFDIRPKDEPPAEWRSLFC
jgi:hypothetical protein